MQRWRGKVAVVTGASAGIGAAIAYQLQDAGVTVVALARRKEKIQEAVERAREEARSRGRTSIGSTSSPGKIHFIKCDVSEEESVLETFKWVKDTLGSVHILVNNAGVGGNARLDEPNSTEKWQRTLNTNVLGLSICTREAVQIMKTTGVDDGHIVHIGSKAGHSIMSLPGIHMYGASKHALRVLTEGLRKELVAAKSRIRVTEVSPGAVKTDFAVANAMSEETLAAVGASRPEDFFDSIVHLKSEDVADAVLYALSAPAHVQIHEIIMNPVGELF